MNIEDRLTPETDAAFLKLYAGYVTHPATIDLQAAEKFTRNLERQRDALREALEAFSNAYTGNLEGVGGGTRIAPSLTAQHFKDARATLAETKPKQ